nr:MAG TPA: hypothetical protein [Caudoviricetes sp.]
MSSDCIFILFFLQKKESSETNIVTYVGITVSTDSIIFVLLRCFK